MLGPQHQQSQDKAEHEDESIFAWDEANVLI